MCVHIYPHIDKFCLQCSLYAILKHWSAKRRLFLFFETQSHVCSSVLHEQIWRTGTEISIITTLDALAPCPPTMAWTQERYMKVRFLLEFWVHNDPKRFRIPYKVVVPSFKSVLVRPLNIRLYVALYFSLSSYSWWWDFSCTSSQSQDIAFSWSLLARDSQRLWAEFISHCNVHWGGVATADC